MPDMHSMKEVPKMHGLFNYDGTFVQTMNKIADCICLSFLWFISSLPVITIGASTAALYYSMNKCVRRSEGKIWKTYWHSFRGNFKQASSLWMILLVIYGILTACCYSAYLMCINGYLPKEVFYFLLIVIAAVTIWASFLFPYLAKFQNTNRLILKNCVYIMLMHFPVGLLHLVLLLLSLVAVVIFPLAVICVPGIYMVLSCYKLEPIFQKYMSAEDRAKEEALDKEADL